MRDTKVEAPNSKWRRAGQRHLAVGASAAVLAMAATVCGPMAPAGASVKNASSARNASSKIGGTLTVWSEWTGTEQSDFEAAYAPFEKETGVKILYRGNSSNEATALEAAVAGGKGPDVGLSPEPSTLTALAAKHALTPIKSIIGSEASDYGSAWNSLGSYKGTLYGVWYKAANKNTIWYNPAEFAAAGIKSTPTTWEQLMTDAGTLSAAGITPFSVCGDIGWPVADFFQNVYLKEQGATAYNNLATGKIAWTSPGVTRAFETMADIFGNQKYMLGGTSGTLSTSNHYPECVTPVFPKSGTPTAAMVIEADFVVSQIVTDSTKYKPGTTYPGGKACSASVSGTPCYNFFPFPAPAADKANAASIQVAGDVAMLINPTPAAKAFIKYLASPKPAEIWAKLGGFTSPNKAVPLSSYPDSVTRADAQDLASAKSSVFSLDDEQGSWEPDLWQDMLNFVKNPASSNITSIEATMEKQAKAAGI